MAFPTHGIIYGSSYSLNAKRKTLPMQNGKTRAIAHRPNHYRVFDVRTVPLTETQADEWDTHYDTISDGGTDTISFDGTSYTCFYLARPERIEISQGLFNVFARLREA